MSFTPDEIEAMEQTVKSLERWAKVDSQYTVTNCDAHKMSVPDILWRIATGVSHDDRVIDSSNSLDLVWLRSPQVARDRYARYDHPSCFA